MNIFKGVNRTRNGTCMNRVVLVLWKKRAMYGGASWALSLERASTNVKIGKNLGQNTRGHRYITVPDKGSWEGIARAFEEVYRYQNILVCCSRRSGNASAFLALVGFL
jgi:hypothetical protein